MAFDHLPLPFRLTNPYNSPYGPGKRPVVNDPDERTIKNRENRKAHGEGLNEKSNEIIGYWQDNLKKRRELGLPELPEALPLFLQVDPNVFDPDRLRSFGIDVISEEEDGFLIGASADLNLGTLKDKIEKFLKEEGKFGNTAAQLWDIVSGKQWRIDRILSKELLAKWDEIDDSELFVVDIAIASHVHIPAYPNWDKDKISKEEYQEKIARWEAKRDAFQIEQDELSMQRQGELEAFIQPYQASLLSSYVESADSFSCRMEISGKGLKDLVLNYPYLFEVEEYDDLRQAVALDEGLVDHSKLEIFSPAQEDPNVCVIDSGIQENHALLEPGIATAHSISYIKGDPDDTADYVERGGHGTRVAGAVLHDQLPITQNPLQLSKWVQNARVLDKDNKMPPYLYPPDLVEELVGRFYGEYNTRVFNMSITSKYGYITTRMSKWAEAIDQEQWNEDIVFVLPSGNLTKETIHNYLLGDTEYAGFLLENKSRVANPSQSLLSLTVGSVSHGHYEDEDVKSIAQKDYPSSFTRTGLGIWGSIKPELVEYGGDYVVEKESEEKLLSQRQDTSLHLVRSTMHGGPATAIDGIGSSFSAPRVASILSTLESLLPKESALLYKALVIQSARWPEDIFKKQATLNYLRLYGYGMPNLERATSNNDHRVTLTGTGSIVPKEADIYEVKLPESLRRPGDSYDILIEVTLVFKAKPRRTRVGFRSYFSGWADWHSSNFGESSEAFKQRLLVSEEPVEVVRNVNEEKIPWTINDRANAGIRDVKLNNNVHQKDWALVKSNKLTESFGIGVVGHAGWDKDLKQEIPYAIAVSFEAVNKDIEIYNRIRVQNQQQVQIEIY
ncbi:S8 family peptidase [Flagellimonas flava]|uniref:S8 family peptidase n=1 Tax=Flagellimonas flava TaxID=570519 RepID=UPI003D6478EE